MGNIVTVENGRGHSNYNASPASSLVNIKEIFDHLMKQIIRDQFTHIYIKKINNIFIDIIFRVKHILCHFYWLWNKINSIGKRTILINLGKGKTIINFSNGLMSFLKWLENIMSQWISCLLFLLKNCLKMFGNLLSLSILNCNQRNISLGE